MSAVPQPEADHPTIWTAGNFLRQLRPIETIVDGLPIPRGGLVSLTGPTGHGKTTMATLLQVALVRGVQFAGRDVTRGSVLVLAGENPDDWGMHLLATLQDSGLRESDLFDHTTRDALLVVPGTFGIAFEFEHLAAKVAASCSPLVAVLVDTSAAYFVGADENGNVDQRQHASVLRELSTLPGRPAVIVLCHPVKSAQQDNLLPRGGGAFLAEVDANLTAWKDASGVVALHWAGKIRGSSFDAVRFELKAVELAGRKDCRGKPIFSAVVRHIPDDRVEVIEAKALDDENRLLVAMQRKPGGSVADLAMAAGFTTGLGIAHKSKVSRLLAALKAQGLVRKSRSGAWTLTPKGRSEADEVRE